RAGDIPLRVWHTPFLALAGCAKGIGQTSSPQPSEYPIKNGGDEVVPVAMSHFAAIGCHKSTAATGLNGSIAWNYGCCSPEFIDDASVEDGAYPHRSGR